MVPIADMPVGASFAGPNDVNIKIIEKSENSVLIEFAMDDKIINERIPYDCVVQPTWFPIVSIDGEN